MFLHCLEQGGLGLRRRTVDFVSQNDIGENRALNKLQDASSVDFIENLGARYVGRHQVGRKLNAAKLKMKHLSHTTNQKRFCQSRRTCNQTVRSRKKTDQQLLDDRLLTHDRFRQLRIDLVFAFANQPNERRLFFVR